MIRLPSFSLLACLVLAACPGPQVDCRVGADCASGVCLRDGTCTATQGADAGNDGGATVDGGQPPVDGGANDAGGTDAGVDSGMPIGCLPNHDGRIERSEVFFQAGLRATFRVSGPDAGFDTAGTAATDGGRRWDFTQALPGDASRLVETRPVQGQWYESSFPDAGYVSELGQGGDLLGVFGTTSDGLYLQGVVSAADGSSASKLHYTPWVKVLQFPLQAGASWSTDATVSGKFQGFTIGITLPLQRELYTSVVDRVGDAVTPFAGFPSLRVRTVMERYQQLNPFTPEYKALTLRTFSWNSECFGTVATVSSTNNESSTEFTSAAEVKRLSP